MTTFERPIWVFKISGKVIEREVQAEFHANFQTNDAVTTATIESQSFASITTATGTLEVPEVFRFNIKHYILFHPTIGVNEED